MSCMHKSRLELDGEILPSRVEVDWIANATCVMSDLADAVFSGQLTGYSISGEELNSSFLIDSAIKA